MNTFAQIMTVFMAAMTIIAVVGVAGDERRAWRADPVGYQPVSVADVLFVAPVILAAAVVCASALATAIGVT